MTSLAFESDDRSVRLAAAWRLDDVKLVTRVVIEDDDEYVRDRVFRRFEVKSSEKQAQLAEIVVKSQASHIQHAAFFALTTPSALGRVALESENVQLRKAALARIEAPRTIAKIAMDDANQQIRLIAVGKLTDQPLLWETARTLNTSKDDADREIQLIAFGRITDQSVLEEIVWDPKAAGMQGLAMRKIGSQDAIENIARKHPASVVRSIAAGKLLNQALVLRLAREDKDELVRVHAIQNVESLDPIAGFAIADSQESLRKAAVARIATRSSVEDSLIKSYSKSTQHDIEMIDLAIGAINSTSEGQDMIHGEFDLDRQRKLSCCLIDLLRVLRTPLLLAEIGEIESIDADWHWLFRKYVPKDNASSPTTMKGESFTVRFSVKKRPGRFQYSWKAKFPLTTKTTVFYQNSSNYRFQMALSSVRADIQFAQALEKLFATVPQELLSSIATDDKNPAVRALATRILARMLKERK